jgi:hypothetical protein
VLSFDLSLRRAAVAAVLFATFTGFAAAQTITGTVTNKTTNKPSGGDDVVLIRLAQGMQEAARTKTDARGHYSIALPDQGLHLIRVTHDKANYFQPAQPGVTEVNLDVYNAAAKVKGITGEADVMRLQTDAGGKNLQIVENFFVKNESTPPMTQFSDRPFEFYLPAGAVVEGSAALSPGGMPVQASPVPLDDSPNHYAFIFPIRPGETRFQITYHVPYSGNFTIAPKPSMPTDTIAIMMPKSMTFKANASAPYSAVTEETTAQTYVARNVSPSQPLDFTIGGSGQLPRDTAAGTGDAASGGAQPASGAAGAAPGSAATDTRPGGGLGNPIDPTGNDDPWAKYRGWIIGGLGLILAAGAGVMFKGGQTKNVAEQARVLGAGVVPAPAPGVAPTAVPAGDSLLAALKEELFALETDRLNGKVSEAAYAEQKAALDIVLRRALGRSGTA